MTRTACAALLVLAVLATPARAAAPKETVAARAHFFGAENVGPDGDVRSDRVLLSWFSVASMAMAIDGHVVLLDTYIHKAEDKPNYVPTTTDELAALDPEAIFIGHGHFDHANTAGELAARTGALVIGTPEHCDQARAQAEAYAGQPTLVNCVEAVPRASMPGAQSELAPLGPGVAVTALKHVHSAAVAPDGEMHETSLAAPGLPDANATLLHPPGPGTAAGLASSGDENGTILYQFRVGRFALTWHDSVGPLRELAPQVLTQLEKLPRTDVEIGATLGFNDPTNGQRDPVDYLTRLKPRLFFPVHHDFIAEYGTSKGLEGVFRRELAKRDPVPTEVRWLYDPYDYVRPGLMSFDVARDVATSPAACRRRAHGLRILSVRTSGRRVVVRAVARRRGRVVVTSGKARRTVRARARRPFTVRLRARGERVVLRHRGRRACARI